MPLVPRLLLIPPTCLTKCRYVLPSTPCSHVPHDYRLYCLLGLRLHGLLQRLLTGKRHLHGVQRDWLHHLRCQHLLLHDLQRHLLTDAQQHLHTGE